MRQKAHITSDPVNFYQVTLSEVKLDEVKQDGANLTPIDAGMLWVSLAFILGWTVIFFKVLGRLTILPEELVSPLQPIDKIPCKSCQFYSTNRYLPCAVHPSIALTEQAIHCSDYCCQDSRKHSIRFCRKS